MRIWIGRGGSGKTTALLREIAGKAEQGEGRQFLLVPELFSHAYERRLAEATHNHGGRTAEVITFSRLTGRVFAEMGGLADVALTPAGRLLTLTEAARRVDRGLATYRGLASKPALVKEMLTVIDECKTCRVRPEDTFRAAGELKEDAPALAEKLGDLSQLFTAYEALCENTLADPRDRLTRMAGLLPQSTVLRGAEIYLDGFASFTPQEVAVLEAFLTLGLPVTAAVTFDPGQADVFVSADKTVRLLRRMAARRGEAAEITDFGACCIEKPHDLAVLEREGLLPTSKPQPSDGESVRLFYAANPFEECEYAAAYIRRKVSETGARWRDFAVISRDGDRYTAALQMAMARYDVPIFHSAKADLLTRPPLKLVTGALAVLAGGWRYEDVFGCLKTGLCSLEPDEIDKLENYALTWRVRGAAAWRADFTGHPDGYGQQMDEDAQQRLGEINLLRHRAAAPFAALQDALHDAGTAREFLQALYDFLERQGTPGRMAARAARYEEAGELQLADEYRQLWEILVSAMEEMDAVCGDAPMDLQKFASLLPLVLGEYDVGSIPVSLDRVTCGAIDRVCGGGRYKHLILLGANDGLLPKAPAGGGILSDNDRQALEGLGLSLSASGAERMLMEQETIYKALACPTESLLICCHRAGADGKEARPSYLLGAFQMKLQGLPAATGAGEMDLARLCADRPAAELACAALAEGARTPAQRAALAHFAGDERVRRARAARTGRGPVAARETVEGLYGKTPGLTASRVDLFYSCRFAFFMRHGLRAKPRRKAAFAAPETGTFIHYVLENTLAALDKAPGGARAASADEVKAALRESVRDYVETYLGSLDKQTARFRYLFRRLARQMEGILQNVLDELRDSDFAPIDYELKFGFDGDLPPVRCADGGDAVLLSGTADRVDGYVKDGRLYVRVMDYKSGYKAFSLSDVWNGLNLQLILYLFAIQEEGLARYRQRLARELDGVEAAGILYVPARDEVLDLDEDEPDEDKLRALKAKALRRSGLVSDDLSLLEAMEHGLSGDGRFLPVKLKAAKPTKKNPDPAPELSAASAVADLEKFGRLARFAQGKLIEMGRELKKGGVEAAPCRHGQALQCDWCEFRAACRFDETLGDRVRSLTHLKDSEFWEALEKGGDAHAEMDRRTARRD